VNKASQRIEPHPISSKDKKKYTNGTIPIQRGIIKELVNVAQRIIPFVEN
jgi:hypothetical protein